MATDGSICHIYNALDHNEFLAKHGRKRKVILGDGNCLFRALSYLVYGNQDAHPAVRQALATIVERNRDRFEQYIMEGTFDEHIMAIKREGAWGSQVELFAAATYFRMPLYVCSPPGSTASLRKALN